MNLRLLVPIDELDVENPALMFARLRFPGHPIRLLHVVETQGAVRPQEPWPETALEMLEIHRDLSPAQVIVNRACSGQFDLVVMGTERKGNLQRFFLGSVAEAVVRRSPIPVITVRNRPALTAQPLKRVLMMYDFSAPAQRALAFVQATFPQAVTDLLHVVDETSLVTPFPVPGGSGGTLHEQFATGNDAWYDEALRRMSALGGEVVQGDPAGVAIERAQAGHYDLLALGSSAKSALEEFFLGSVARRVLRESPLPVLTVRPPASP